jgi:hypothetical protein
MHIAQNIRLSRILKNTWQVDLIMIISSTLAFLMHEWLIKYHFVIPVLIPTVLGTAIAFFIGFNNNQAYDRWWEARKIWGMLVNDSRSWARSIISYVQLNNISEQEKLAIRGRMITRHIGFLYALKGALRGADDTVYKNYLSEEDRREVASHSNIHNAILQIQARDLNTLFPYHLQLFYQGLYLAVCGFGSFGIERADGCMVYIHELAYRLRIHFYPDQWHDLAQSFQQQFRLHSPEPDHENDRDQPAANAEGGKYTRAYKAGKR